MDFVSDELFDGRRFRALTLVDNYSRECLEIEVGQSLKGGDVVAVMERIFTYSPKTVCSIAEPFSNYFASNMVPNFVPMSSTYISSKSVQESLVLLCINL